MGEAGRRRARALFDWQVVVGRYQELWAEQAAMRGGGTTRPRRRPGPPLARQSRSRCSATTRPGRSGPAPGCGPPPSPPGAPERLGALRMNRLDGRAPNPSPLSSRVLERVRAAGPRGLTQAELLEGLPAGERQAAALAVGWLMKLGLVE